MTAIQGVHPYADKFPMLPESDKALVGMSADPLIIAHITESNEHPGFYDASVTTASGIESLRRPIRGDEVGSDLLRHFVQSRSFGVDLNWSYKDRPKQVLRDRPENIYFVSDEDGYIKIGFAKSVPSRLAALQTASRQELTLLATIPGSLSDEAELHRKFAADRVRGEWFHPSKELLAFIRKDS